MRTDNKTIIDILFGDYPEYTDDREGWCFVRRLGDGRVYRAMDWGSYLEMKGIEKGFEDSFMKCPHRDCRAWKKCYDINSQKKHDYAKQTRFTCVDCGDVCCFYCGDLIHGLCIDCKEDRLS